MLLPFIILQRNTKYINTNVIQLSFIIYTQGSIICIPKVSLNWVFFINHNKWIFYQSLSPSAGTAQTHPGAIFFLTKL